MTVDLHVDPIIQRILFGYDIRFEHGLSWRAKKRHWLYSALRALDGRRLFHRPFFNHIDLPRMRAGGYSFAAFGIHHWPRQSEAGWRNILRQLTYFRNLAGGDTGFVLARTPADLLKAQVRGVLAGFPAVEGAHCLGSGGKSNETQRLQRLRLLREEYGVGYLTLAHFSRNDAATPAMGLGCDSQSGLSDFGKALVHEMNELGILVDVAHVNNRGVLDACRVSRKPVIVSHAGLGGIREHPRNISDEALEAIAATGGLVGVVMATNFLSADKVNPDSAIVVEHIDYIVQKVGEDFAAIGSDFDGWIPRIPADMNGARDLPVIARRLRQIGYNDTRIRKILGLNFMRVWNSI